MNFTHLQVATFHANFIRLIEQVNETGSIWQGNGDIEKHVRFGGVEQDNDCSVIRIA